MLLVLSHNQNDECVSCLQSEGEPGKGLFSETYTKLPAMFPREMSLHDKGEAIRKPLKYYFLSVARETDLILQLQTSLCARSC